MWIDICTLGVKKIYLMPSYPFQHFPKFFSEALVVWFELFLSEFSYFSLPFPSGIFLIDESFISDKI